MSVYVIHITTVTAYLISKVQSIVTLYKTLIDILYPTFTEDTAALSLKCSSQHLQTNLRTKKKSARSPAALAFPHPIAAAGPKFEPSAHHAVLYAAGRSEASLGSRGGKTRRRRYACSQMPRRRTNTSKNRCQSKPHQNEKTIENH